MLEEDEDREKENA